MSDGLNINISSYIERSKEKGKNVDFESTTEMLDQIHSHEAFEDKHYSDSVWEFDADAEFNEDTFSQLMSEASDGELEKKYVDFLYEFLDVDGNGKLTSSELSVIMGNDKSISGASIKYAMNDYSKKTYESSEHTSISADDVKDEKKLEALKLIYGDDVVKDLEDLEGDESKLLEKQNLDDSELKNVLDKLKDGTFTLEHFEDLLTEESYKALESEYNKYLEESQSGNTSGSGDVTGTDEADGSQGAQEPEGQQNPVNPQAPVTPEQQPTGDKSIDDMRTTIANMIANDPSITPEDVISQLDPDVHGQEFIDQLRASYNVYENESAIDTQWEIQKLNNPDITRLEVIEIMRNNGTLGKLVKDSTMPLNETTAGGSSATLSDDRVKEYTTRLWELAPPDFESAPLWLKKDNYDNITNLLVNDKLSDADVVNIIANMTPDEPGNWLWMLQESGDKEMSSLLLDQLLPKIADEALAGNEKAIEILCNAIEMDTANSTEGLFNKNHLLLEKIFGIGGQEPVMEERTDELLSLIKNEYPKYNNDAELIDHISGEWLLDNKDDYKDKLTFLD